MGAGIHISDDKVWLVRLWAFQQLLEDVRAHYPGDREAHERIESLLIVGYVAFENYDADLGARLARMIYTVANGNLSGTIPSSVFKACDGQEEIVQDYLGGIRRLVELFEADGRYSDILKPAELPEKPT